MNPEQMEDFGSIVYWGIVGFAVIRVFLAIYNYIAV